jgi:hypothetical protein
MLKNSYCGYLSDYIEHNRYWFIVAHPLLYMGSNPSVGKNGPVETTMYL